MASVKQGTRTASPEWWKHLDWMKRRFWKGERQAIKREIVEQMTEAQKKIQRDFEFRTGQRCGCCGEMLEVCYKRDEC